MHQFGYAFHYLVFDYFQIFGSCACYSYFSRDDRLAVSYNDFAAKLQLFALKVYAHGNDLCLRNGCDKRNTCFALADLAVL